MLCAPLESYFQRVSAHVVEIKSNQKWTHNYKLKIELFTFPPDHGHKFIAAFSPHFTNISLISEPTNL